MPMEVLRFHIKNEDIRKQVSEFFRNLIDGGCTEIAEFSALALSA